MSDHPRRLLRSNSKLLETPPVENREEEFLDTLNESSESAGDKTIVENLQKEDKNQIEFVPPPAPPIVVVEDEIQPENSSQADQHKQVEPDPQSTAQEKDEQQPDDTPFRPRRGKPRRSLRRLRQTRSSSSYKEIRQNWIFQRWLQQQYRCVSTLYLTASEGESEEEIALNINDFQKDCSSNPLIHPSPISETTQTKRKILKVS